MVKTLMATTSFTASGKSSETIVVDETDWPIVSQFRWYAVKRKGHTRYAIAPMKAPGGKICMVLLHRFLLDAGPGDEIDHIDGNALNNSRSNLRFVTHSENIRASRLLPGRYGNATMEELDRELAAFEAELERM